MILRRGNDEPSDRASRRAGGALAPGWLIGALFLASLASASGSAQTGDYRPATLEVVGLVIEVEPSRLMIQSIDGSAVDLKTLEDFSGRVTVGAKVTAWYHRTAEGDVLTRLEAPEKAPVSPASLRQRLKKIILLPNSSVDGADGLYDGIRQFLQARLGWYVAPAALAAEIRRQARPSSSTLDAFDPATGEFDLSRYLRGSALIPRLASEARTDGVLEVDVDQVEARVNHMVASWDDIEEPLAGSGLRTLSKITPFAGKGELPAATVTLRLLARDGTLLWSRRRGLALLVVPEGGLSNRLRPRPLAEWLTEPARLRSWLAVTFTPLMATPAASPAPSHP